MAKQDYHSFTTALAVDELLADTACHCRRRRLFPIAIDRVRRHLGGHEASFGPHEMSLRQKPTLDFRRISPRAHRKPCLLRDAGMILFFMRRGAALFRCRDLIATLAFGLYAAMATALAARSASGVDVPLVWLASFSRCLSMLLDGPSIGAVIRLFRRRHAAGARRCATRRCCA